MPLVVKKSLVLPVGQSGVKNRSARHDEFRQRLAQASSNRPEDEGGVEHGDRTTATRALSDKLSSARADAPSYLSHEELLGGSGEPQSKRPRLGQGARQNPFDLDDSDDSASQENAPPRPKGTSNGLKEQVVAKAKHFKSVRIKSASRSAGRGQIDDEDEPDGHGDGDAELVKRPAYVWTTTATAAAANQPAAEPKRLKSSLAPSSSSSSSAAGAEAGGGAGVVFRSKSFAVSTIRDSSGKGHESGAGQAAPLPAAGMAKGKGAKQPFKFVETVRGRERREALHGFDCDCCRGFYEAVEHNPTSLLHKLIEEVKAQQSQAQAPAGGKEKAQREAAAAGAAGSGLIRTAFVITNKPSAGPGPTISAGAMPGQSNNILSMRGSRHRKQFAPDLTPSGYWHLEEEDEWPDAP